MFADYIMAAIDVHKKMLAVVVTNVAVDGPYTFQRRIFGTTSDQLAALVRWLAEFNVQEIVMESTAQYWKTVWRELEAGLSSCRLHLAQAFSNRAPHGRKEDFRDAERLVRRFVAGELTLSFVPDAEQQLWRTVSHTKHQITRDRAPRKSAGSAAGRLPHQTVERGQSATRRQQPPHAEGPGAR